MKRITETLRVLRLKNRRGISQAKLAKAIGMPPHRYWEIEQGLRAPSKAEQGIIARALKASPADIFDADTIAEMPREKRRAS